MFKNILQCKLSSQHNQGASTFILKQAQRYLRPLEDRLDQQLDRRLVRTFFDLFATILLFRNRSSGLLLSELGGYICGFVRAPAGTKRISNLLRSKKWTAGLIDDFLFERTRQRVLDIQQVKGRPLMLWDDSRLEKPESWLVQGLCSVWSSKGKRLTKIKKGYFSPPASRICVPGFEWTAVLLSSLGDVPSVCRMSWWTTRGKFKEQGSNLVYRLLGQIHTHIGRAVTHVLDRGYATTTMLEWLFHFEQDFIIRWKQNHLLEHSEKGKKKTHLLARSFPGRYSRIVWDKNRKKQKRVSISWTQVTQPEHALQSLFLIIARDKNHYSSPMYLLTSLEVKSPALAWEVVFSYLHRWEVEQGFRFNKSELAMESPRLWFWENRLKFLAIVALVYDFLLRLLRNWPTWVPLFLRQWCHRTGERYRKASIPLYRLRIAISVCLLFLMAQNSG